MPQAQGSLTCSLQRVEVLGRDTSIVCTHPGLPERHPAGHHPAGGTGGRGQRHRAVLPAAGKGVPLPEGDGGAHPGDRERGGLMDRNSKKSLAVPAALSCAAGGVPHLPPHRRAHLLGGGGVQLRLPDLPGGGALQLCLCAPRPLLFAGGGEHLCAGGHYGAHLHGAGHCHRHGVELHQAPCGSCTRPSTFCPM